MEYIKDYKWIEDKIRQIMITDGPDRHTDGSDYITCFILALLKNNEEEWWKDYEKRMEEKERERAEWRREMEIGE